MSPKRNIYTASLCVLWLATTASAATVTFAIQPQAGDASQEIVVTPGGLVAYEITALVTSDDAETPDHNGLSSFIVDVLTDLGVIQDPVDELDADIAETFTYMTSLGLPSDDDILDIGGSQDILLGDDALTLNIAVDQAQVLARGSLIAPAIEGTFTVAISTESEATVFASWNTSEMMVANTAIGDGFAIRTDFSAGDDTGDDTEDNTGDGGNTDNGTIDTDPPADPTAENPVFTSTLALAGTAALVAGALLLFGPIVSGVVLVLALVLVTILSSLSGL